MKPVEYYLMRHASYYDHDNQYVTYHGMLKLKNSVDNLLIEISERSPNKKLRIIHSILPRAKHTALLIRDIINPERMDVFMTGDSRLNSDKLQISNDYINEMVNECERVNEICLILSHQPDIECFSDRRLGTSEWIRMIVNIEQKIIQRLDSDDDLPF